jgi:nicotinate-nucleotide--dimethylbenzimidazole phosphoribosyltransferase
VGPEVDLTLDEQTAAGEVASLVGRIGGPDHEAHGLASRRLAELVVPAEALGHLAEIALSLACLSGFPPALLGSPALLLAAGDHGVRRQGLAAGTATTTRQLVETVLADRASVSPGVRTAGARLVVLDVGLEMRASADPRLVTAPVRRGTADLREGDALRLDEARRAVLIGARVAQSLIDEGADVLALGDLGAGNQTASAALTAVLTGVEPGFVAGRPVGADSEDVERHQRIVGDAVRRTGLRDPLETLASLGGTEHAALTGAILAAAARRVPVLLDGVAGVAAALVALAMAPDAGEGVFVGNLAPDPAAVVGVRHLGLRPLLDLDVRLGDGSGALLALPVLQAAASLLREVATLDELAATDDSA